MIEDCREELRSALTLNPKLYRWAEALVGGGQFHGVADRLFELAQRHDQIKEENDALRKRLVTIAALATGPPPKATT